MKAIITVGISASGKSTWAKEYAKKNKAIISCRDDLRFSLTGASGWGEYKFDKKIENTITRLQHDTFGLAQIYGKDIIVADTNLNKETRENLHELLYQLKYDVEILPFPITLEEAWKRDGLRANGVGRDVIYKQWQQWLEFIGKKQYTPDTTLPKAVCFDMDGTLAHMVDRKAYDWKKVGTDRVDPIVRGMLWDFRARGYKIVILSGRDSICREETYQWIIDNGMIYDELLMRQEGDMRKDTVIKEEIFWKDVSPHYNVEAVVDDRPVVCRMWRDIKIPKVIQVGDPYVEF
jgi:predicted kinase